MGKGLQKTHIEMIKIQSLVREKGFLRKFVVTLKVTISLELNEIQNLKIKSDNCSNSYKEKLT